MATGEKHLLKVTLTTHSKRFFRHTFNKASVMRTKGHCVWVSRPRSLLW